MKRLILMRHARAETRGEDGGDKSRALHPKGLTTAQKAGRYLRETGCKPELIIHSSATRTVQTAWALCEELEPAPMTEGLNALYLAAADEVLKVIRHTEPTVNTLIVVGHNPGISDLTINLIDGQASDVSLAEIRAFPPNAFSMFDLDINSWVAASRGHLAHYQIAEDLP